MKVEDPRGKPRIVIPSVVSRSEVKSCRHLVSVRREAVGRKGMGEVSVVDVRITLLSARRRRPRAEARRWNS